MKENGLGLKMIGDRQQCGIIIDKDAYDDFGKDARLFDVTEEVGERAGDKEHYDDLNDEQRKGKVEGDVTLE